MKDNCYIDNVSVWNTYGVWVTKGGYDDLLSFPSLVEPEKNIWPEEDGIEVDLSNPVLSGKEVSISFMASRPGTDLDIFLSFIARPGYRIVRIASLGREWKLRLLSQPENVIYGKSGRHSVFFVLKFADDFPLHLSSYPAAEGCGIYIPLSLYSLDGKALDRYGIVVEEGRNSLLQSPGVRQNLTRKISTLDGVLYDVDHLVFSEKDVTLKCRLNAVSIDVFWQCYIAFFGDLIKPNERLLNYKITGKSYKCYYKNTGNWKLISLSGGIMVEFNLTLVFTSFRNSDNVVYLLATETEEFIITEDDNYIDLSITRPNIIQSYVSAAPFVLQESAPENNNETEIKKRKITEMPAAGSLEDLILPAVDKTTNQNVHIPTSRLKSSLTNIDNSANDALFGSILIKGEKWQSIAPVSTNNTDFDEMLLPVYHKQLGWMFIPVSSLPGGEDIVTSGFPYTFPLILA